MLEDIIAGVFGGMSMLFIVHAGGQETALAVIGGWLFIVMTRNK